MMPVPGAARSTQPDADENGSTASFSSVAATVSTCGNDAGYDGRIPVWPLFADEATTRQPLCTAVRVSISKSPYAITPLQITLNTTAHGRDPSRIPCTSGAAWMLET